MTLRGVSIGPGVQQLDLDLGRSQLPDYFVILLPFLVINANLVTVGIRIPDMSGIRMVQNSPIVEWSGIQDMV